MRANEEGIDLRLVLAHLACDLRFARPRGMTHAEEHLARSSRSERFDQLTSKCLQYFQVKNDHPLIVEPHLSFVG